MIWTAIGIAAALVLLFTLASRVRSAFAPGAPAVDERPPPAPPAPPAPTLEPDDDDDPVDITLVRAVPIDVAAPEAEDEEDPAAPRAPTTTPFYPDDEPDAGVDEPTQPVTRFLVSACGQTDRGRRRRRNEDSHLMALDKALFVVADGMGGYAGGDVASKLAVATVREVFEGESIDEPLDASIPRRGAEIAWAVQKANAAIFALAKSDPTLSEMGTTVVAARFSPNKQRAYIAHVGDSRAYRFRSGRLRRLTTDHTMSELGMAGPGSDRLYRAVGIAPAVDVDLVIDKPRPDDIYLFCSDGLTKMASEDDIGGIIQENAGDPEAAVYSLIEIANDHGGKDNVTCIVVKVVEEITEILSTGEHHEVDVS